MARNTSSVARALVKEDRFHLGLEKLVIQRRRCGRRRSRLLLGCRRHGHCQEQTRHDEHTRKSCDYSMHRNLLRDNLVGKITNLSVPGERAPSIKKSELRRRDFMGRGSAEIIHACICHNLEQRPITDRRSLSIMTGPCIFESLEARVGVASTLSIPNKMAREIQLALNIIR
jgi:hypothetical protein